MKYSPVFLAIFSLQACSVGHGLTGERVEVEANLPLVPQAYTVQPVSQTPELANWLSQFDDSRMLTIVDEALMASPTIIASEATARAARENARALSGRSLPSVTYNFNNSYSTTVRSTTIGEGIVVDGRFSQPDYSQSFQLNWELDLWGRVRANIDAAEASYQASQADLAAARLSIAGQAATAWVNLNNAMEQERIARLTFDARKNTLDLTERRFSRGLSTALDVRTARTQLASAEAQIFNRLQSRNSAARQLEVFLGRYPANEIDAPSRLPVLTDIAMPGDPSLLLTRRPDIAASEARLEAAGLTAEAARLAIFPSLRASSSISNSSSIKFTDIFDPQRISANILASLSQSVWQGGALRADRKAAVARAEVAAANYTNTVLTAWREVEDALDADILLREQEMAQERALEEAHKAEDLALRQYQRGLVSIFNLIQAQTTRLNSEANVIQIRASRVVNRINYHLALGGGPLGQDQTTANTMAALEIKETKESSAS